MSLHAATLPELTVSLLLTGRLARPFSGQCSMLVHQVPNTYVDSREELAGNAAAR